MDDMHRMAQRNAMLVHGLDWSERRAGIFEPAPIDELAVATTLGLVLNCLSSGLYMVSPLRHISWRTLLLLPDVSGMHVSRTFLLACMLACCSLACLLACSTIYALTRVPFICICFAEHLALLCCLSNAQAQLLVQANYQLVLPNIRDYLTDIGAAVSMAGVVIGCCDIASIPGTIGRVPLAPLCISHQPVYVSPKLCIS